MEHHWLLILHLPNAGTSKKKKILLPCMQGPFNYFSKVHSICRIVLLLPYGAWSVLFQAQDEWHYLLYSYYRSLLWRRGVWSDAIYHARHEALFLSNTFSPTGRSQCTSLMHFQIYWTSLFIYFAFNEQASLETPGTGVTVLVTLVSKSIELLVIWNILWG